MNLRRTTFSYAVILSCGGISPSHAGAAIEQCGQGGAIPVLGDSLNAALCSQPLGGQVDAQKQAEWAPWTHRPYCAGTKYCVYTNAMFADGGGVSIITTPGNMSRAVGVIEKAFAEPPVATAAPDTALPPPYVVQDVPGKGKGAIATRRIPRGEAFVTDPAAVMGAVDLLERVAGTAGHLLLATAIDQLPDPQRVLALAGSYSAATSVAENVMRTNTFAVSLGGEPYMALFPEISRINHACKPNAHTRFSPRTLAMSAVAIRDIEPGEEISISYAEFGTTYGQRQHALLHNWGFRCTCALCTAPESELLVSDRRRRRMGQIRDGMLGLIEARRFAEAVEAAEEMVRLVVAEGLASHLAEHYEVLARLHMALGDGAQAVRYARLAVADLERFGGPDDEGTLADMREIAGRKG